MFGEYSSDDISMFLIVTEQCLHKDKDISASFQLFIQTVKKLGVPRSWKRTQPE